MNLLTLDFRNIAPKAIIKNGMKALVLLLIGFVLTFLATKHTIQNIKEDENAEFESVCKEIKMRISLRLHSHAQLLRSGAAFFAGSVTVTRSEWKAFNEREKINYNLPGIQGVGVSVIIPENKLQEHIQSIRNEGFPDYRIKPEGTRDIYTSIIYLEPFSGRNLRAFGYDMYSEPVRRKAMDRACDSDIASLSGKVILVQETSSDIQAGTLMYVPVYKNGLPVLTTAQRRSAILGWVYSPYRMRDLMHGILGRWDSLNRNRIHMQVFDDSINDLSLLFDSQNNETVQKKVKQQRTFTLPVEFNGTKWILYFNQSDIQGFWGRGIALIVLLGGIVISLLISFLSYSLLTTHFRAIQIAEKLSDDLKASEERFKKMFERHDSVMLLVDPTAGDIIDANRAASSFYGCSIQELCTKSITAINTLPADQTIGAFKDAVAQKQNRFTFKHRLSTNEIRDVEIHSSPVDISGKTYLFSIIHDITERRRLEEALQLSELKLRAILDNSYDAIGVHLDGIWQWCNPAALKLFGVSSQDDLIGSPILNVISTSERDRIRNFVKSRATETQAPITYVTRGLRADGTEFDMDVILSNFIFGGKDHVLIILRDITERVKNEKAIRDSEDRYRTLFENTGTSIVILEEDMTICLANEEFARSTGFSRDEIEGVKKWTEIVDIEDVEMMVKQHKLRREAPPSAMASYEFRYRTKSGEMRTAIVNAQVIPGTKKSMASLFDITDRKNAEAKIARMQANYETFFNSIDDLLFVLDAQGNIIHTNSLVLDRLGYSREELIGKPVLLVHPPERREEAGRIVGEMLSGLTEYCPVPVMTKSGIQIPVETRVSLGFWDDKPVIFGVTKDISQLRLSEEKFSKLFYLNPAACGLSDLETHTYVEVNDGFYNLFGYTPEEVIGKTAFELGLMTSETAHAILLNADSHGRLINAEADLKSKSGEIKKVLMSAENIYVQDKKYRFTIVIDLTERARAEQEIARKNEELYIANAEKDKFFSIIAHDLRSPFNSLLGFSKMLVEELPSMTSENIEKVAVNMSRSANKLYNLLENLLEWSKMQRGLTRFIPEPILLLKNVDSGIEIIREAAIKKMIDISVDIPWDLAIMADVHMFESLIRNLVFNAVKFTPAGGRITISAKPVADDLVEFSICDTGIGMDEIMIEKLFSLSENTNRKGTEGEPSTGLGLILCKEFIEKSNGKIWVRSHAGQGSTFYFTLPSHNEMMSHSISSNEVPVKQEPVQMKKLKILITEDDEVSELFLLTAVAKISTKIFQAKTGTEAVETCQQHPDIDLILMDIKLPGINGYEAIRQIRQFNKDVVIIAQTAYGFPEERENAIKAGCDDYIAKPIDKKVLMALIQKHFNKK